MTHKAFNRHADLRTCSISYREDRFNQPWLRSKTPPEGYSVFLSYGSSMCKTEIEHPRVPFSNASQQGTQGRKI